MSHIVDIRYGGTMHVELSQKLNKNLNYDINGMNPTFSIWTHMDSSLEND